MLFLFLSCRDEISTPQEEVSYEYSIPESKNDGWETGSITAAGLNENRIFEMMGLINSISDHKIHGIIIAKDGKLILEEYFKGYKYVSNRIQNEEDLVQFGPDTLHYLSDISKITIPLIFGKIKQEGFVYDTKDRVLDYLQDYSSVITQGKGNITLENLMGMNSGLDWEEYLFEYGDERSDIQKLIKETDPVKYFFEKDLLFQPGSAFDYNSGNTIILTEIIERLTGQGFKEYCDSRLFQPLGIQNFKWDLMSNDMVNTSGGLYLSLRDLTKLGQLFADEGAWRGTSVISREWISFTRNILSELNYYFFSEGYGLHLWKYGFEISNNFYECIFWAGWGEQYLFVFPELDLVFAISGGYYYELVEFSAHSLIEKYILSAIEY